jgi:hypothetical protein
VKGRDETRQDGPTRSSVGDIAHMAAAPTAPTTRQNSALISSAVRKPGPRGAPKRSKRVQTEVILVILVGRKKRKKLERRQASGAKLFWAKSLPRVAETFYS